MRVFEQLAFAEGRSTTKENPIFGKQSEEGDCEQLTPRVDKLISHLFSRLFCSVLLETIVLFDTIVSRKNKGEREENNLMAPFVLITFLVLFFHRNGGAEELIKPGKNSLELDNRKK